MSGDWIMSVGGKTITPDSDAKDLLEVIEFYQKKQEEAIMEIIELRTRLGLPPTYIDKPTLKLVN